MSPSPADPPAGGTPESIVNIATPGNGGIVTERQKNGNISDFPLVKRKASCKRLLFDK